VKGNWTTEGTVRFEYDGGVTVQRIAQEKHDEHLQNSVSANLETYIFLSSFNLTTDLPKITNRSMNDFTIS
jgi:hypothetical protein